MESNNGWITDRLPTAEDAYLGKVLVWVWELYKDIPYAILRDYSNVKLGTPWQPIIEPPPYVKPRWKPKEGEEYFVCSSNCVLKRRWDSDYYDKAAYKRGNCFETEEEAHEVFEKITQLLKEHHDGK